MAEKRVDFGYNLAGGLGTLDRYHDLTGTNMVASSTYGYDFARRLTSIAHSPYDDDPRNHAWTYDAANRVATYNSFDGLFTYGYDPASRLTSVDLGGSEPEDPLNQEFTYDLNGTRLTTDGGDPNTIDYNRVSDDGRYAYTYNGQGNLTVRVDTWTGVETDYTYDYRDRLIQVQWALPATEPSTRGTALWYVFYRYDPFDRLISREGSMALEVSTLNENWEPLEEPTLTSWLMTQWREMRYYDGDHVVLDLTSVSGTSTLGALTLKNRYLYGDAVDQILAQENVSGAPNVEAPERVYWFLGDNQQTTRDLVDNAGVLARHYVYGAYGNVLEGVDDYRDLLSPALNDALSPYESAVSAALAKFDEAVGYYELAIEAWSQQNTTLGNYYEALAGAAWSDGWDLVGESVGYWIGFAGVENDAVLANGPALTRQLWQARDFDPLTGQYQIGGDFYDPRTGQYLQRQPLEVNPYIFEDSAPTSADGHFVVWADVASDIPVSRWGRPGLQPGDFVMTGPVNKWNYFWSGKWQPRWVPGRNIPASFASGETFLVNPGTLDWPRGVDALKGIVGQRNYNPGEWSPLTKPKSSTTCDPVGASLGIGLAIGLAEVDYLTTNPGTPLGNTVIPNMTNPFRWAIDLRSTGMIPVANGMNWYTDQLFRDQNEYIEVVNAIIRSGGSISEDAIRRARAYMLSREYYFETTHGIRIRVR